MWIWIKKFVQKFRQLKTPQIGDIIDFQPNIEIRQKLKQTHLNLKISIFLLNRQTRVEQTKQVNHIRWNIISFLLNWVNMVRNKVWKKKDYKVISYTYLIQMISILKVILIPSLEANLPKSKGDEQAQMPTDQPQPIQ